MKLLSISVIAFLTVLSSFSFADGRRDRQGDVRLYDLTYDYGQSGKKICGFGHCEEVEHVQYVEEWNNARRVDVEWHGGSRSANPNNPPTQGRISVYDVGGREIYRTPNVVFRHNSIYTIYLDYPQRISTVVVHATSGHNLFVKRIWVYYDRGGNGGGFEDGGDFGGVIVEPRR